MYALLIAIGFVYLYPLLFMFVTSIKSPGDLLNPMVQWVPTEFYLGNYDKAFRVLDYPNTLLASLMISVIPSMIQTCVASLVGYGLARYRFWGKSLVFLLLLATFIIPPQNTVIPQMLTYRDLGLLGNPLALILPALLGQGYKSAIFILIFYQSFLSLPKVLEEVRAAGWGFGLADLLHDGSAVRDPGVYRLVHFLHRLVLERNLPDRDLP